MGAVAGHMGGGCRSYILGGQVDWCVLHTRTAVGGAAGRPSRAQREKAAHRGTVECRGWNWVGNPDRVGFVLKGE